MTTGLDETYTTGARRSSRKGKGRYDLLSPWAIRRLARLAEYGADRYGARNNERGIPNDRCVDSALRHIYGYRRGETDPDHGDHLAAAAWNVLQIMDNEERLPATCDVAQRSIPTPPVATTAKAEPLRIYVAGPFSADHASRRYDNMLLASWSGLICAKAGHLVHVPHAATFQWHGELPYEAFMSLDLSVIEHWATAVLQIGHSPGADREAKFAESQGLKVYDALHQIPGVPVFPRPSWAEFYLMHGGG